MKRLFLVPLLILLVAGLVFAGCAKPAPTPSPTPTPTPSPTPTPTPTPAKGPIKMGALIHYTGMNAVLGKGLEAGYTNRLDLIGWEVAGRKIELIKEDDATDATIAVDKARKLVESDKVDVVLGPLHGGLSLAVAQYLTRSRTPNMGVAQRDLKSVQFGGGNIFNAYGTYASLGYPLGYYVYDKLGYRTATVAYDDFISGQEFIGGVVKGFESRGGKIIQTQPIPQNSMDFSSYLAAMKQADAVFFWFTPATALRFLQQYYDYGLKMPLVIPNCTVIFEQFLAQLGDKSIGITGSATYSPLLDNAINKTYAPAFTKKYGFSPTSEYVGADIGLSLYLEAVKNTGGDTSFDKIIAALHKVKADTPAGTFSFNEENIGIGDMQILQTIKVTAGQYGWKPVYSYKQMVMKGPDEK